MPDSMTTTFAFPESLITQKCKSQLPQGLTLRPLSSSDFNKGYLKLLSQLTVVGEVSESQYNDRFTYFHRHNDIYFPIVIEDVASGTVVAAGTLLAEKKFIRNCGMVGHIEDIVVSETMRGKRLGIRIIETLVEIARQQSCYKVILNCNDDNVTFYEKCGFKKKEVEMALYL